jgi:carboxypeptidase PM20D1
VRLTAEPATPASPVSDASSEGFTAIQRAIRETYGDVIITPGLMVAASDSRHYGQVADNAFRFNPMIVRSEDLTGFHGTNEKIAVDNLAQGTRTYVQIMKNGSTRAGTAVRMP